MKFENKLKSVWKKYLIVNNINVYNEKYLIAKINLKMEKSTHIFTTIKIPKESSKCIFLPVLLVNSVWKTNICKYF